MTNGNGLCQLKDVLEYKCIPAIKVFRRKYLVSETEASHLWQDLLQWLWLGRFHQIDPDQTKPDLLFICPSIVAIDEMWHAFLLCTEDYSTFCNQFLGAFIHHVPNAEHEGPVEFADFESNYLYVLKHLGAATAVRWYFSMPLRFQGTKEASTF